MPSIKYSPLGHQTPSDITTNFDKESQLWQELVMQRHLIDGVYAKRTSAPYIDQARLYYLDARSSNWRSAGLLYYYPFLNLAKAYVLNKRAISHLIMRSSNIYHGLSAKAQNPSSIIDYIIKIHPPNLNGQKNIFALLYERLTLNKWPFKKAIDVRVADFLGYAVEISSELNILYEIPRTEIRIQSVVRSFGDQMWFEIALGNYFLPVLRQYFDPSINRITATNDINEYDMYAWLESHGRNENSLINHSLIRFAQTTIEDNLDHTYQIIREEANSLFKNYATPIPLPNRDTTGYWGFVPPLTLQAIELTWHPFLTNYLFAFAISDILRYNPDLIQTGTKDALIAESWCNESPITMLAYFVLRFTKHNHRFC